MARYCNYCEEDTSTGYNDECMICENIKEDERYCNYCSKSTGTKEEDCVICGLSKPSK